MFYLIVILAVVGFVKMIPFCMEALKVMVVMGLVVFALMYFVFSGHSTPVARHGAGAGRSAGHIARSLVGSAESFVNEYNKAVRE